jgi:hypothetical protein
MAEWPTEFKHRAGAIFADDSDAETRSAPAALPSDPPALEG